MKLNSFKFQDGKVLWLPEYPEKRPHLEGYIIDPYLDPVMHQVREEKIEQYNQLVAQSLASAIEVASEDMQKVKRIIWWQHESLDPLTQDWPYDKDKVYSAECEIWIVYQCLASQIWGNVEKPIYDGWLICYPQNVRQVARLKPTI